MYFFDLFCGRNRFFCQIQMFDAMIAFISHNVKVADLCQFFHGFGQRRLVNTDNFRHFLGSRSGMFIKIFHIELLSPSDYPKIFAI